MSGLKQAPRAWYFKLHKCLISRGFVKSNYGQSLYLKRSGIDTLIVRVYVDDLIVVGTSSDVINTYTAEMKLTFEMNDLGSRSSYLGFKVKQEDNFIFLSQKAYTENILERTNIANFNTFAIPLEA